jgi:hypothetical protein
MLGFVLLIWKLKRKVWRKFLKRVEVKISKEVERWDVWVWISKEFESLKYNDRRFSLEKLKEWKIFF